MEVITPSVVSEDTIGRVTLSKRGGAFKRMLKVAVIAFSSVAFEGKLM